MKEKSLKQNLFKLILPAAGVAALFIALPNTLPAEESKQVIPDKLEINIQAVCQDLPGLDADKKKVGDFSHALHAQKFILGKSGYHSTTYADEFTCAACHTGATSPEEIAEVDRCERIGLTLEASGGAKEYKKQMHAMCIDCHKSMNKAGEKTGPTKCNDCHSK